jgi:hypothetical protein
MLNVGMLDNIPLAVAAVELLFEVWIIGNVVAEALADNEANQRLCAFRFHAVRNAIEGAGYEISGADGMVFCTDGGSAMTRENINALLLGAVCVQLCGSMSGLYGDEVNADVLEASSIPKGLVDPNGIIVEKMDFLLARHFSDGVG